MRRRLSVAASLFAAALLAGPTATAADAGVHPDAGPTEALPSGHPDIPGDGAHGSMQPDTEDVTETMPVSRDAAVEDASLPAGTIVVRVVDGAGKPLADEEITLGILYNSVAKGESRKRIARRVDANGEVRFDALDVGSGVAYRVSATKGGGTFALMPFQLPAARGMRTTLTVHDVTRDVEKALVVSQTIVYAEVKDDRVQLEQAFRIYNFGKNAWVPDDLVVPLPPEFTAFNTQQGMSDVAVEAVPNKGVRLKGTFTPGQHTVQFRFQLPYAGTADVPIETGVLPHTAAVRVIVPAARGILLDAPGFPPAQSTTDGQGQRALVTERQLRREEPALRTLSFTLHGLPTEGPGKLVATFLATVAVAVGLVLGTRKATPYDPRGERARLLDELAALERSKRAGDVGPKTYERARRDLLDALARTFRDAPAKASKASRKTARAAG